MAKILHVYPREVTVNGADLQVKCETTIVENEAVFTAMIDPIIPMKTALSVYKLPAEMNMDLLTAVQDYLLDAYKQSGFDRVYLTGGFA